MTFLKRPLAAHVCVYACVSSLASLFASFWSGNDYVTRVRDTGRSRARSDVTCTFAFHEVARTKKEIGVGVRRRRRGGRERKEEREAVLGGQERRVDDAGARIRGAQPRGKGGSRLLWARRRRRASRCNPV